jgi:pyruvate kinase
VGGTRGRTKIVCTIGPASSRPEMLDRLVAAGMDVARLNFSHGTHADHVEVIHAIREGEARWGRPITILQDLQGPKVRLGTFVGGQAALVTGEEFVLTSRTVKGTAARSSLNHPEFLAALRPGDPIWMDDGMLQLSVEKVEDGDVHCRIVSGGTVSDHKGVSFPRLPVPVSCLAPKDREDLRFGIEQAWTTWRSVRPLGRRHPGGPQVPPRPGRQHADRGQARAGGDRGEPAGDLAAGGRGHGGAW